MVIFPSGNSSFIIHHSSFIIHHSSFIINLVFLIRCSQIGSQILHFGKAGVFQFAFAEFFQNGREFLFHFHQEDFFKFANAIQRNIAQQVLCAEVDDGYLFFY